MPLDTLNGYATNGDYTGTANVDIICSDEGKRALGTLAVVLLSSPLKALRAFAATYKIFLRALSFRRERITLISPASTPRCNNVQLIAIAIASPSRSTSTRWSKKQSRRSARSRYSSATVARARVNTFDAHTTYYNNLYRDIAYRDAILYYTLYPVSVIDTTSRLPVILLAGKLSRRAFRLVMGTRFYTSHPDPLSVFFSYISDEGKRRIHRLPIRRHEEPATTRANGRQMAVKRAR